MSTLVYDAGKDELRWQQHAVRGKPQKVAGPFSLWWSKKHGLCAVSILSYTEQMGELRQQLNSARLEGILGDQTLSEEDITSSRLELTQQLEAKW